jgi:type II secretory pathway component PulF
MGHLHTPRQLKRTAEFYRQLAAFLAAGIPAVQALRQIASHPPSPRDRSRWLRVADHIESGSTLAEALAAQPRWLPVFDVAIISAGERSGRLVESCRSLAEHYTGRAQLYGRFIISLLYPAFLLHVAVLVFPPAMLPRLVWHGEVGAFLAQKLGVLLPLYAAVFAVVYALQSQHGRAWQAGLERLLHVVPVLGTARRELALARLSAALEALINAGVNVIEAWGLAADASGSPTLQRVVHAWEPRVRGGELPSALVSSHREFPQTFANLYFTGEISGQLDQELRHLHAFYQDSSTRRMTQFAVALGLLITLAVMGSIAFFIVQFWLGYFRQISDVVGP